MFVQNNYLLLKCNKNKEAFIHACSYVYKRYIFIWNDDSIAVYAFIAFNNNNNNVCYSDSYACKYIYSRDVIIIGFRVENNIYYW